MGTDSYHAIHDSIYLTHQVDAAGALAVPEVHVVGIEILVEERALLAEELHALVVACSGRGCIDTAKGKISQPSIGPRNTAP